ncbi:hypothetical protein D5R93_07240 [Actinomyces lilanjuaniae]|uniref:Uncharacterized protein n=1 Tax=Actinomyces lilanjuaniae TaxID=2321394 RepID=A0ABM6Z3P1_9ACTO|nr:hypothetical protein D5R93_07240 [Actinomyces lilanjuaniae]
MCYGQWWRGYDLCRAWQLEGVWERVEAELVAQANAVGKASRQVLVGSTACRTHAFAAGNKTTEDESADHVSGAC